jgi:hypothetical protein
VVVQRDGYSIALGDVAHIANAPPPPTSGALVGPQPGVLLAISAQSGADLLSVTEALDRELAVLAPALKSDGVVLLPDALRPASFVLTALHHLRDSLILGAALILAVLFLALRNWRTAAISFVAIPSSLLMAIVALDWLGFSLNTMSLGGLAIAIGEVVDDAVVDVENIYRRLRENRMEARPRPTSQVVLEASLEVRGVSRHARRRHCFLPVLGRQAWRPLVRAAAVAYIAAIMASLMVALTMRPRCPDAARPRAADARGPAVGGACKAWIRPIAAAVGHPGLTPGGRCVGHRDVCERAFLRTSSRRRSTSGSSSCILRLRPYLAGHGVTSASGRRAFCSRCLRLSAWRCDAGHAELSNEHAGTNKAEMDVTLTPEEARTRRCRVGSRAWGAPGHAGPPIPSWWSGSMKPVGPDGSGCHYCHGSSFPELDGDAGWHAGAAEVPGANGVSAAAAWAAGGVGGSDRRPAAACADGGSGSRCDPHHVCGVR